MDPAGFSESPVNRVTSAGVFAAQLRDTGWWPEPAGAEEEATQDPVQCGFPQIVLITNEGADGLGKQMQASLFAFALLSSRLRCCLDPR